MAKSDNILRLGNIVKTFPGVKALSDVSLDVGLGEIHALIGENGAGKSTVIKILGGLYRQDSGSITFDGKELHLRNAHQSQEHGISIIYQEFNLLPDLTVAENIFVGREPLRGPLLDWKALRRMAAEILHRLEANIDPMVIVADLTVAEKQMVEIAKALSISAKLIIMDEPTASLSDHETEKLLEIVRSLKEQGKTILFVSHRLKEVFAIADRVTVMRDGCNVGTVESAGTDEAKLVHMMVGRDVETVASRGSDTGRPVALEVRNGSISGVLNDINFSLYSGEILGVAGLMGSGRTELAETLYGLAQFDTGEILVADEPVSLKNCRQATAKGIGFLTEDRKSIGVFPDMTVQQNLTMTVLQRLTRWGGLMIDRSAEAGCFREYRQKLDIRCRDSKQKIQFLSGGNQQKVLLARALTTECRVLILCEPTRGVDVGAKAEIHGLMNELARNGVAIMMISSDLPEIISMSDRSMIMHEGRVAAILEGTELTETQLMGYATGQMK